MSARRRAAASSRSGIRTIGQAYEACQFRSLVSMVPGTPDDLLGRVGAAFAALGGEVWPIEPDRLAELVDTVLSGQTVIVMADRADLRDAAKSQIMAAANTAALGAAGHA